MALVIYYVPCPNVEVAQEIINQLLSKRLVACGNIIQSGSIYMWEGSMSSGNEWIVLLKSVSELSDKIETSIKSFHPYEIPAIIKWPAQCNTEYLEWVKNQVSLD